MGCGGGYRDLFRIVEGCGHSGRGYGRSQQPDYDHYQRDDLEEKLIIIKKMYAEDFINDEEYLSYKQRVYEGSIGFDELVAIRRNKANGDYGKSQHADRKSNAKDAYSKYKDQLKKLRESKEKIIEVQDKITAAIEGLEKEKKRIEALAEAALKSSDETAEKYINKKIDLEENILNLVRRSKELEIQVEEIDRITKQLEAKELEMEAVKLQEELSNVGFEDV